jgi:hypothetical protein
MCYKNVKMVLSLPDKITDAGIGSCCMCGDCTDRFIFHVELHMRNREYPKIFSEVKIALKKKLKATKHKDRHTVSLVAHTGKVPARMLRIRIERTI